MAVIHNRMPAILRGEGEALWVDSSVIDAATVLALLQPFPADELEAYPVSARVNELSIDDPECLQPWPTSTPS